MGSALYPKSRDDTLVEPNLFANGELFDSFLSLVDRGLGDRASRGKFDRLSEVIGYRPEEYESTHVGPDFPTKEKLFIL